LVSVLDIMGGRGRLAALPGIHYNRKLHDWDQKSWWTKITAGQKS